MVQDRIFNFTVGQLVELLQTLPQDLPILTSGYKSGFENIYNPEIVELKHEPENFYHDGEFQVAQKNEKIPSKVLFCRGFYVMIDGISYYFNELQTIPFPVQLILHSSKQTVAQINQFWIVRP